MSLNRQSPKARAEHRKYVAFVAELMDETDRCEVGWRIRSVDPTYAGCTYRADGLHHIRKRSAGGGLRDRANVLRSCNTCNGYIEDHPDDAHLGGLVARHGEHLTICQACPTGFRRDPVHPGLGNLPTVCCPLVPRSMLYAVTREVGEAFMPCPMLSVTPPG